MGWKLPDFFFLLLLTPDLWSLLTTSKASPHPNPGVIQRPLFCGPKLTCKKVRVRTRAASSLTGWLRVTYDAAGSF